MLFKLHIDLVPLPLWGRNLRSAEEGLGDWRWRKLRAALIEANGKTCAICGSEKQPHGHEVWEYTTKRRTGIAKLMRVEIICRDCHTIHHWALQVKLVAQGQMDGSRLDELMDHFCRINACKPKDFRRHMNSAMAVYLERSKLEWDVDWGPYEEAVELACASREARAKDREDQDKSHKMRIFDGDGPPDDNIRMHRGTWQSKGDVAGQRRRAREREKAKKPPTC